jgi:hypothetical protein
VLTIFKSKKGKTKVVKLTPKIACKIAKNAKIEKTSLEDCLKDIELRAKRGYSWTYMLQVEMNTIMDLEDDGWDIKRVGFNDKNNTYMIRINWK